MDFLKIVDQCPTADGWGMAVTESTTLNGVPYAPFSKGDKLGRMADWTIDGKDRDSRNKNNRNHRGEKDPALSRFGRNGQGLCHPDQQAYGSSHALTFNAPPAEDESTFSVVSNVRDTGKAKFGRGGRGTSSRLNRVEARPSGRAAGGARGGTRGGRSGGDRGGRGGARGGRRFGWKDYDRPLRNRDATITVKNDWTLLEEIDFNRLGKLNLAAEEGEDVRSCGFVYQYDRTFDRAPTRGLERKLQPLDRSYYNPTTSQDPVIQELAANDEATIFVTASILSMLMCAPRSVYPWDIVIVKQGNKIFLDKRDNAALDLVTVNENAADAPMDAADGNKDTINMPAALAEEATYINHNFANQVVVEKDQDKVNMEAANPFYNAAEETDPPASKAYKYRRFDLSSHEDEPIKLIVRAEIDAVTQNATNGSEQFVTVKALNEFDSKAQGAGGSLDWRAKLVSQRGAVLATEMKNNSCKLARWTTESILAGADQMKVGFVSRANPRQNDKHIILGVIGWKPRDFARQMNLSLSNGWGIVRTIADMCQARPEGKFVLAKDPNKPVLRLYEVPEGTFDDDDEEEEDAEGEGAEEDAEQED